MAKIYFAGAASLALSYGIYAIRKLDQYDWRHSKAEIFFTILLIPPIWPIAMLKPRVLFDMDELIPRDGLAGAYRERGEFEKHPPPCGAFIKYRGSIWLFKAGGEFLLPAAQVENLLRKSMFHNGAYSPRTDQLLVYNWLRGRDESSLVHGELPERLARMLSTIAYKLARSPGTRIHCLQCDRDIALHDIETWDSRGSGSSIHALVCPAGHQLIGWRSLRCTAHPSDWEELFSKRRKKSWFKRKE